MLFTCLFIVLLLINSLVCEGDNNDTEVIQNCHFQDFIIPNCTQFRQEDNLKQEYFLNQGEYMDFFWYLEDYSRLATAEKSGFVILHSPCSGLSTLLAAPGISDGFPRFDRPDAIISAQDYADNSIVLESTYGSYYISIYANETSTFKLAIYTVIESVGKTDLGDDGEVIANPLPDADIVPLDQTITIDVSFKTLDVPDTEYFLYIIEHSKRDDNCSMSNKNNKGSCMLKSLCGIEHIESARVNGDPVKHDPNQQTTVAVGGLVQTLNYTFNVVAKTPEGMFITYHGAEGKPDTPEVENDVVSPVTIVFIVLICVVIVGTLVAIFFLKKQVLKKVQ